MHSLLNDYEKAIRSLDFTISRKIQGQLDTLYSAVHKDAAFMGRLQSQEPKLFNEVADYSRHLQRQNQLER
jgi:hypothetical protein